MYTDLSNAACAQDYTRRLTLVVMSEFGRRLRENANHGTDHGHGNAMFVLGGNVNGGQVYGSWPGLRNDQLYDQRRPGRHHRLPPGAVRDRHQAPRQPQPGDRLSRLRRLRANGDYQRRHRLAAAAPRRLQSVPAIGEHRRLQQLARGRSRDPVW